MWGSDYEPDESDRYTELDESDRADVIAELIELAPGGEVHFANMVQVRKLSDRPDVFHVDNETGDLSLDEAVEYVLSNPLPFDEHDDDPGPEPDFDPEFSYSEDGDGGIQTADEYYEFCNSGCSQAAEEAEELDDLDDEPHELPSY
jgi:hypothetical protein